MSEISSEADSSDSGGDDGSSGSQRRRNDRNRSRRNRGKGRGKNRSKSRGLWWKFLLVLAILTLILALAVQSYVRRTLGGPDFRGKIAAQLGKVLKARVEIPHLDWQDKVVRVPLISAAGCSEAVFSELRVEEVGAQLELSLFNPEVPIPITNISRVRVKLPVTTQESYVDMVTPLGADATDALSGVSRSSSKGGIFSKKPKLGEIRVQALDVDYAAADFALSLRSLPLSLRRGQSDAHWAVSSHPATEKAALEMSFAQGGKFLVQDVEARLEPDRVEISQFQAAYEPSKAMGDVATQLSITGYADEATHHTEWRAKVERLRLSDWLPEDWLKRVTGEATLEANLAGDPSRTADLKLDASLHMTKGMVQGFPFLETLAEKTKAIEFTRLELSTVDAKLQLQGNHWTLRDIVVESRGLLKLTGRLTGVGDQVQGFLEVGATPGRLRSIDGAEQKVFTRQADGYLWADPPMRVWGRLDDLHEDLGQRMQDAWIGQKIEQVVDLATQAPLKATETGVKAVEGGLKLLENAPGVIEQGARFLEGLFPGGR